MKTNWDLTVFYKDFDDPAFKADLGGLDASIAALTEAIAAPCEDEAAKLTALVAEGAPEDASGKAELIAEQIWRLSVLAQRKFTADELKNFLAGSFDILTKL